MAISLFFEFQKVSYNGELSIPYKAEELGLFEKIRENYRQSKRLTACWYHYIDRMSNYSKLEAAKVFIK